MNIKYVESYCNRPRSLASCRCFYLSVKSSVLPLDVGG
jgi:hypothetical protein